jgi:hypothetical protein
MYLLKGDAAEIEKIAYTLSPDLQAGMKDGRERYPTAKSSHHSPGRDCGLSNTVLRGLRPTD